MAWAIHLSDDVIVRTDHLPVGQVIDIAKRNNASWIEVVDYPMAGSGELMRDMVETLCALHRQPFNRVMTMVELAEMFQTIPDETPDEEEGSSEEAEGDPQTEDAPPESG